MSNLQFKFIYLLFTFIFLILPKPVNAFYDSSSNSCYGSDGSCTLEKANVCEENGKGPVPGAQCIRSGPDIWTLNYPVCRVCVDVDPVSGFASCDFRNYEYTTATCSAVDRCYGSNVGGTGYDAATSDGLDGGRVVPGLCVESAFNPDIGPSSACPSGGTYKRCCSSGGYYPTTYCSNGVCPAGQITAAGITSCNAAPPPPSTCPDGVQPGQACSTCTTQTCSNGTACGTGHNYCVYDPTNGNYCGDCVTEVNTCSSSCTSTRSCNVSSWTFSPSATPQANSTVSVTVNGTATPDWNGASYSLDAGPWNSAGSGPAFNFDINSGNAGIHTLRFAIDSGTTVCGDTSSNNSFSTQSL